MNEAPQSLKLVFGAHAAGKSTFVASIQPERNIGSRSFDPSPPFLWERFFNAPGLYEIAPMLPGAVQLFDPYNSTASLESINFKNLVVPPPTFTFIHVEPPFEEHLRRYMVRDGKRLGLSQREATQLLVRLRGYYRGISQALTKQGRSVSKVCV